MKSIDSVQSRRITPSVCHVISVDECSSLRKSRAVRSCEGEVVCVCVESLCHLIQNSKYRIHGTRKFIFIESSFPTHLFVIREKIVPLLLPFFFLSYVLLCRSIIMREFEYRLGLRHTPSSIYCTAIGTRSVIRFFPIVRARISTVYLNQTEFLNFP